MSVSPSERKELCEDSTRYLCPICEMLREHAVFRDAGYGRFLLTRRGTEKEMPTDPRRWTKLDRAFVEASM